MSGAYIVLVVLAATASIVFFMTLKNGATDTENIINAGNVAIYQFPEAQLLLASLKERYLDEVFILIIINRGIINKIICLQ